MHCELIVIALNVALVLFSIFVVPETRGKTLEALERELAGEPRSAVGVDNDSYLPLRDERDSDGLRSLGKRDAFALQQPVRRDLNSLITFRANPSHRLTCSP